MVCFMGVLQIDRFTGPRIRPQWQSLIQILGCISCGFSKLTFALVRLDIGPR